MQAAMPKHTILTIPRKASPDLLVLKKTFGLYWLAIPEANIAQKKKMEDEFVGGQLPSKGQKTCEECDSSW